MGSTISKAGHDFKDYVNSTYGFIENFDKTGPSSAYPPNPKPDPEKKKSPCCVCKETKQARDACIIEKGEENCSSLIEAHKECMRQNGFEI